MGKLEEESKRHTRNKKLQQIILATIATAGIMSVAAVAPNAMQMFKLFGVDPKKRQKEIINASKKRMISKGFLQYVDGKFLKLTPKGKFALNELERCDYRIKKPKRWDKKWRVVTFDIKEDNKQLREKVRRTLCSIGFKRLHDSVWIYPYDCEDWITLIKSDFKIGKDMLYMIVESLEGDKYIKKLFNL